MPKIRGNNVRKQLKRSQSGVADQSDRLELELSSTIPGFVLSDIDHSDPDKREIACLLLSNLFNHQQPDLRVIELLVGNRIGRKLCGRLVDSNLNVRLYAAGALRNMSSSGSSTLCTSLFNDGVLNASHATILSLANANPEELESCCAVAEQMLGVIIGICEQAELAAKAILLDSDLTNCLKNFCTLSGFHSQLTPIAALALYTCCDDNHDFISNISENDLCEMFSLLETKKLNSCDSINLAGVVLNAVLLNENFDESRKHELTDSVLNALTSYLHVNSDSIQQSIQREARSDDDDNIIDHSADELNACSQCIELFINFQLNSNLFECNHLLDHCLHWLSYFIDHAITPESTAIVSAIIKLSDRIWSCLMNSSEMNDHELNDKLNDTLNILVRLPLLSDDCVDLVGQASDLISIVLNFSLACSIDMSSNQNHIVQFALDMCKRFECRSNLRVSLCHVLSSRIPTASSSDDLTCLTTSYLILMDTGDIDALHVAINYLIDLHASDDAALYQIYVDLDLNENLIRVRKNLISLIGGEGQDEYEETLVNLSNFIEYKRNPA